MTILGDVPADFYTPPASTETFSRVASTHDDDDTIYIQSVAIIGMHRSGTSCLAGCLEDMGLQLGARTTSSPHNLKGNRENPAMWPLHDTILRRAGGTWDNPPGGVVPWTVDDRAAARWLLHSYRNLPAPWGFKDPRATLLLDGWLSVLPRLRVVASVRHPVAVAASLAARNGFDEDRSLAIWAHYNRAVLRWHSLTGCAVVNYDAPDYEHRVRGIAASLDLAADRPIRFRSTDLNHHGSHDRLPESVAAIWHELLEVTG